MSGSMDTHELDQALIGAMFEQAGLVGWRSATLVDAARAAELDLGAVRARFPNKAAVLLRFGSLADQAVLAAAPKEGSPRERLFDLVMSRFDQLQQHRAGVLALMEALKTDPGTTLLLYGATLRSMQWLLEAADIPTGGVVGMLRIHGLAAVWGYGLRAWERDEGADLPATMAAVDRALDRAVQAEGMLPGRRAAAPMEAELGPDPAADAEFGAEPTSTTPPAKSSPKPPPKPPTMPGADIASSEDGPGVL